MSSFNEFLQSLTDPKQKRAFIYSLLAMLCWLIAISIAILSNSLQIENAALAVYASLLLAVVFSLISMPKPTSHSAAKDQHEHQHLQHH